VILDLNQKLKTKHSCLSARDFRSWHYSSLAAAMVTASLRRDSSGVGTAGADLMPGLSFRESEQPQTHRSGGLWDLTCDAGMPNFPCICHYRERWAHTQSSEPPAESHLPTNRCCSELSRMMTRLLGLFGTTSVRSGQ